MEVNPVPVCVLLNNNTLHVHPHAARAAEQVQTGDQGEWSSATIINCPWAMGGTQAELWVFFIDLFGPGSSTMWAIFGSTHSRGAPVSKYYVFAATRASALSSAALILNAG
jgi:hypothetical protein